MSKKNDAPKDVLISINPHWCKRIADGEKTVEIRKTQPNQYTPFKVYVYATKPVMTLTHVMGDGEENYGEIYHGKPVFLTTYKGSLGCIWGRWQKQILPCFRRAYATLRLPTRKKLQTSTRRRWKMTTTGGR